MDNDITIHGYPEPTGEAALAPVTGSTAQLLDALKECHRHIEALYFQAGGGTICNEGLDQARKRANKIADEIVRRSAPQND